MFFSNVTLLKCILGGAYYLGVSYRKKGLIDKAIQEYGR